MQYTVGFYVHHHGNGHLMRSLAIASALKSTKVVFLGSDLSTYEHIIPKEITCIHLPMDIASEGEIGISINETNRNFLYSPLNVAGLRKRNNLLTQFFLDFYPLIFVVDTSPEVIALARLCGVPTLFIQQHGNRNDEAHLMAYDSATMIVAPFSKDIRPKNPDWVYKKTFYSGGFSKFSNMSSSTETNRSVAVLVGSGGTSIELKFLIYLATVARNYFFEVIGNVEGVENNNLKIPANLSLLGFIADPLEKLKSAKIIIGNAGHNTVMEMATLNKRFICIPEERPFLEQLDKAEKIFKLLNTVVILPENMYNTDWEKTLNSLSNLKPNWEGMINVNATKEISLRIDQLARKIFKD